MQKKIKSISFQRQKKMYFCLLTADNWISTLDINRISKIKEEFWINTDGEFSENAFSWEGPSLQIIWKDY